MAGDVVSAESAVCLAVCVGWRMAELYDSDELPGPSARREAGGLPTHLPGFGEMSDYEKACALAAHVGADLASLGHVLGLESMPTMAPVLEALQVPRHSRDDVRAVILNLYLEVRDMVAGSDVSAATAFGLGRMLADTTLLPTEAHPEILAERFDEYRLGNAFRWLDDLDARLPARSAPTVRTTLEEWKLWVTSLPRTPQGAVEPAAVSGAVIRALQRQGEIWRRLLTGEQRPDQLLDSQAYIGAAVKLLGAARRIGLHFLWKWSWAIVLAAGAVGAAVWAALTYAPAGTSRVAAVVVSAAGFLGISWLGVRATLGRALRQAEGALWEAEVTAAIATVAATTPKSRKLSESARRRRFRAGRGAVTLPATGTESPDRQDDRSLN
jgi:hypothetical protein